MKATIKKIAFSLTAMFLALALIAAAAEIVLRVIEPPPLLDRGKVVRASANPIKQYELLPGAKGEIAGAPVSIDSFGCRDREYPLEKPEGVVRIVGIGDSLTFGQGVPEEATYLARLERELDQRGLPVEVINCGVFGYNVDEESARFAEVVDQLHPDLVIIGYELGDILRNPPPRRDALAPGAAARSGGGAATGSGAETPTARDAEKGGRSAAAAENDAVVHSPAMRRHLFSVVRRSRLVTFLAYRFSFLLKKLSLRDWEGLYADESPLWKNLAEKYGAMADLARERRIDVIVAIVPELSNLDARYPFTKVHARVSDMCRRRGMRVVDLLPSFLGQNGPSLWVHPQDRHPNARGHAIIAMGLLGEVEARVASRLGQGGTAVVSVPRPSAENGRRLSPVPLARTSPEDGGPGRLSAASGGPSSGGPSSAAPGRSSR